MVTLTIDGKAVAVPADTLIIRAAEQLGVEIPGSAITRCSSRSARAVNATSRSRANGSSPSCTTTVSEGMVVKTQNMSNVVHEAQVANLEFLLLNHPLDCPICDRGGECLLQDQALAFGPGRALPRGQARTGSCCRFPHS